MLWASTQDAIEAGAAPPHLVEVGDHHDVVQTKVNQLVVEHYTGMPDHLEFKLVDVMPSSILPPASQHKGCTQQHHSPATLGGVGLDDHVGWLSEGNLPLPVVHAVAPLGEVVDGRC